MIATSEKRERSGGGGVPCSARARSGIETALQLCRRGSVGGRQRLAVCGRARHVVSEFRFEPGAVRDGVSLSRKLDAGGDGKADVSGGVPAGQGREKRR